MPFVLYRRPSGYGPDCYCQLQVPTISVGRVPLQLFLRELLPGKGVYGDISRITLQNTTKENIMKTQILLVALLIAVVLGAYGITKAMAD
jgi:hypothetical protein